MSHGDSRVGRHSDARRDSGHDLKRYTLSREVFRLLGAAAENQGIAPLEPDDEPAGPRVLDQKCIDLILIERAMPARFPGTDPDRIARNQVEQPGAGQMVVNHDIGAARQLGPAQGQESRITRTRANQVNNSRARTHSPFSFPAGLAAAPHLN